MLNQDHNFPRRVPESIYQRKKEQNKQTKQKIKKKTQGDQQNKNTNKQINKQKERKKKQHANKRLPSNDEKRKIIFLNGKGGGVVDGKAAHVSFGTERIGAETGVIVGVVFVLGVVIDALVVLNVFFGVLVAYRRLIKAQTKP